MDHPFSVTQYKIHNIVHNRNISRVVQMFKYMTKCDGGIFQQLSDIENKMKVCSGKSRSWRY